MTEHFRTHGWAAARKHARGPQRNGPVTVTRVNPRALLTALRLAGGNPARLRVISGSEILVVNNPGRRSP